MYIITDGVDFVTRKGKIVEGCGEIPSYRTITQAEGVIRRYHNIIPNRYEVKQFIVDSSSVNNSLSITNTSSDSKNFESDTIDKVTDYKEYFENISNKITEQYDELLSKLSFVDMELQDIYHIIEFEKFDACKGYKLCKLIQDKRIERREIKRKIQVVEKAQKIYKEAAIKMNKTIENASNSFPYENKFFDIKEI